MQRRGDVFPTASLVAASHSITAVYSGDASLCRQHVDSATIVRLSTREAAVHDSRYVLRLTRLPFGHVGHLHRHGHARRRHRHGDVL